MPRLFQAITLVWVITLLACAGVEKQKVVVYSPHGKPILPEFETRFEAAHPDIDMQWLDMGSQDVLDRLRSERENPQCDLWWGAPSPIFMIAQQEGLLAPYRPSWADQVVPQSYSPDHTWYGTALTPHVIMYNNQVLNREEVPQDWDELLDPKWKNKIIIRFPLASGTMRTIYGAMIWRFYKDTGKPDQGYDWLRKLDGNTKEYAADPNMMFQKIARREGLISLWLMPDVVFQAKENNYPFGYVVPKSGTPVTTDCIALVANAKHAEAAKILYEFVTSKQSMILLAQRYGRIPTRRDILPTRLPAWMIESEIVSMDIDWPVFSEKTQEWMKYWDNNIKGKG